MAMYAYGQKETRDERKRWVYTCGNDICIYIYFWISLLASPGPERKPVDAHAPLFNARHSTDTRKADFTLLRLPCDCCALAPHRSDLCIHLYGRSDFYLDSVARSAALHYSSASYSASWWLDFRLIFLLLNIYASSRNASFANE